MSKHSLIVEVLLMIGVMVALMLHSIGSMWSPAADFAHHYALVARLWEYWTPLPPNDPSLGLMNVYPRGSHVAAAIAGSIFQSPLLGLQLVALTSLLLIWTSVVLGIRSLPHSERWKSFIALAIALLANRFLFKLELHGHEVIDNFFFAQLAGQALVIGAVTATLWGEKIGLPRFARYSLMLITIAIVLDVHLLPALELLAIFSVLLLIDTWTLSNGRMGLARNVVFAAVMIAAATALVLLHPTFGVMRSFSETGGGQLELKHVRTAADLASLCVVVAVASITLTVWWMRATRLGIAANLLVLKYFGAYGLAIAGTCLLQLLLLKAGHGSIYSAKKYAFGLNTALLMAASLIPVVLPKRNRDRPGLVTATVPAQLFLSPLLLFLAVLTVVPSTKLFDAPTLIRAEREIRALKDAAIPHVPGKSDYAINIAGIGSPTIDYLLSIGILRAPQAGIADQILFAKQVDDVRRMGTIITSEGAAPYDVRSCRRFASANSLVLVDGGCAAEYLENRSSCTGVYDFSTKGWINKALLQGFSWPEGRGRWTDANIASFVCTVPAVGVARPRLIRIQTQALLSGASPQRALVSVNDSKPIEYDYSPGREYQTIELPFPSGSSPRVRITFLLPDAKSPLERGMNSDPRKIAISVASIEFL